MKKLYIINREDFFKIKDYPQYQICEIGSLWIALFLHEEDVFTLWCQGIVATPG